MGLKKMMVTGYVLNEDHTKLLMRYHERAEQWLPNGGGLTSGETPRSAIEQYILQDTGVVAHYVDEYGQDDRSAMAAFILEADEGALSKYELEDVYDAQWLTKSEILRCTCIYEPAKDFAELMMA